MNADRSALAVAAVAMLVVLMLATVGAPSSRPPAPPASSSSPTPESVSADGVTLASAEITLPEDDSRYPAGPHRDIVEANCTACHSPGMVLTQPKLSADQWKAEVTKMREVYKAPIAEGADADIVAYLTSLPTQGGAPPPTGATAPAKPG